MIAFLLVNYNLYVLSTFLGLIVGGLPLIIREFDIKKIKLSNYLFMITAALILVICNFINTESLLSNENNTFTYFIIGMIDALTMVIPGISGTVILILFDLYDKAINLFVSFTDLNLLLNNAFNILAYGISLIIVIYITSFIMNLLFKNYKSEIYSAILIFQIGSILMIMFNLTNIFNSYTEILVGTILFNLGMYFSYNLKNSHSL